MYDLDGLSLRELLLLEKQVKNQISLRLPTEMKLDFTDKQILSHVPSRVHRAKYLHDKYKCGVAAALSVVDQWDNR